MARVRVATSRARELVSRYGEQRASKKLAIGALYLCFGTVLVVSGLSTRPLGIAIGTPFAVVGLWALWTAPSAR